jgi:hypothetical protein
MNIKKALLAGIAAAVTLIVVSMISGFTIHGMMLNDLYEQTASFWRPMVKTQPMTQFFICLNSANVVAGLVLGFLYAWVQGGFTGSPAARGFKFGLLVWILSLLSLMSSSIVFDLPLQIYFGWALDHLLLTVIPGIVLGAVYGSPSRRPMMA